MKISINRKNNNGIDFYNKGKLQYFLAVPPFKEGCHIIDFGKAEKFKSYFKGLILFKDKNKIELFEGNKLIDYINY
jgi:hypothetical protein